MLTKMSYQAVDNTALFTEYLNPQSPRKHRKCKQCLRILALAVPQLWLHAQVDNWSQLQMSTELI